jgi:hypothetical protein
MCSAKKDDLAMTNNDDIQRLVSLFGELSLTLATDEPWLQSPQETDLFVLGDLALAQAAEALARVVTAYERGTVDALAQQRALAALEEARVVVEHAHAAAEAAREARERCPLVEKHSVPAPTAVPPPAPEAPPTPAPRGRARAALVVALAMVCLGLAVLLGWALEMPALTTFALGPNPMKANAAVAFAVAGVGLWLAQGDPSRTWQPRAAVACAAVLAGLGGATLVDFAIPGYLGHDPLLFRDVEVAPGLMPGPMPPNTALCFTALGLAGLLHLTRRARGVQRVLTVTAAAVSIIGLLGHALAVEVLYRWHPSSAMSPHASVGLIALSLLLLAGTRLGRPRPDAAPAEGEPSYPADSRVGGSSMRAATTWSRPRCLAA